MDIQSVVLSNGTFNIPMFIIMLILVILSAFFSMSETAFSSASDTKLKIAVEGKVAGAKKAYYLYERFDKTITTLLIGNNLVNVALSAIAVVFLMKLAITEDENIVSIISTVVVTLVLLIFGEIVPKMIAKTHSEAVCTKVACGNTDECVQIMGEGYECLDGTCQSRNLDRKCQRTCSARVPN